MQTFEATSDHGAGGRPSERSDLAAAVADDGGPPRLVTRGETEGPDRPIAIVDWLAFTLKSPEADELYWIKHQLDLVFGIPPSLHVAKNKGWFGYRHRIDLGALGLLAYGGAQQRGTMHVELNAHGCNNISDWMAVTAWGESVNAAITRVDLAHDDFNAEAVSIEQAVEWLEGGRLNAGGRRPQTSVAGDWIAKQKGRTLYIGSRESGKLTRIYEKGKQLGGAAEQFLPNWTRIEVELRNKGRVVPWETVTHPGRYLAGAYPAFEYLSLEQCRLRTVRNATTVTYEAMVRHLRTQGGKAINVMTEVERGDTVSVVAQLAKPGQRPKRLIGYPDDLLKNLERPQP